MHSLAVAMLLSPQQVHHFDDFGYQHGPFYQCPANSLGGQLTESELLGKATLPEGNPEIEGGIGCRCRCDRRPFGTRNTSNYCMRLKQPNTRDRPWLTWFLFDRSMRPGRLLVVGAVGGCTVIVIRHWWYKWSGRIVMGFVVALVLAVFLHSIV